MYIVNPIVYRLLLVVVLVQVSLMSCKSTYACTSACVYVRVTLPVYGTARGWR